MHLLYASHAQQAFLPDPAAFKLVLASRLAALGALLTTRHATLSGGAGGYLTDLQEVLRQGYELLLSQ